MACKGKRMKKVNPYSLGGILASTGSGAMSGGLSPWGAVAGGAVGLVKGVFGHQAEESAERAQEAQKQLAGIRDLENKFSTYTSAGGELRTAEGAALNQNALAMGGFNKKLTTYDAGGSHEENPNGGIIVGMGSNGLPNTVEEDEASYIIDGEPYIFPKRVAYEKTDAMPRFVSGKTMADAAKSIEKAFFGRNDKYSMDTKDDLMRELAKQNTAKTAAMKQQTNQFAKGGFPESVLDPDPMSGIENTFTMPETPLTQQPGILETNLNAAIPEVQIPEFNPEGRVLTDEVVSDESWLQKNQENIDTGLLIGGLGSQLAGVLSNVRAKNQLEKAEPITARTVDPSIYSPNLVNRQNVLRQVNRSQQSAIGALGANAAGNFGAYAANVAGIQGKTATAISNAMLQSDQLDAAELARVQQGQANVKQFNARTQAQVDMANEQNVGAYESQKAAYSQGIAANIGSLGQSMINYVMGTRYAKYAGDAATADALAEPQYDRRYKRRV